MIEFIVIIVKRSTTFEKFSNFNQFLLKKKNVVEIFCRRWKITNNVE
jgi:hypothetical protein